VTALEAETQPAIAPDSVLRLRELSVTEQGDGFVVGLPGIGPFVSLPLVGRQAVERLAAGRTVAETAADLTPDGAAEPVDVLAFARTLGKLGFVEGVDDRDWDAAPAQHSVMPRSAAGRLRWLFTWQAGIVAAASAVAAAALLLLDPAIRPSALDVFFLDSPVRSLALLTLVTYLLAALHELAHVGAAAALGVPARLRITRRLYFLTFETNLTGLWALPPRKRVGPLLAGMGFDSVVLAVLLVLRHADLGPQPFLAALVLVEVAALVTQFFVFLRTDVYAVMTALLGCTNLSLTTRLLLRRSVRALTPDQGSQLAAASRRDLDVARWYRWVHALGMAFAAWFFGTFFLPSTWHLLVWLWTALGADLASAAFWEALVFGTLILSPRLLTLGVAVRDGLVRLRARRPDLELQVS
jgi:putative peptide zinc metalloprotease protein